MLGTDLNLPAFAYDDLFVFAPSCLAWESAAMSGRLLEGKSLGTAKEQDLVFLDKDRTMDAVFYPEKYKADKKVGADVGRKKLRETQRIVEPLLNRFVRDYQKGRITEQELRKQVTATMKKAWKEVFIAGVRASGLGGGQGPGQPLVKLTPEDETWVRSAMKHEMQFLNGMLDAIVDETYVMPLPRRIGMYMDALESFFDSARVIGLPATAAIHWIIPKKDRRVCNSCTYLAENSPYSKRTLPTVPRSGATLCLTNCRDRLFVRIVDQDKALALHQSSPTRGTHIKNLRRIKRLGHM